MISDLLKSKSLLVATLVWVAAVAIYWSALATGERKYDSTIRTMIQWDGRLYVSIARDGYERFPCPDRPQNICGNGGWFPGYPLLGWVVSRSGLDPDLSMLAVSWLAFWLGLLVLHRLASRRFDESTATISLTILILMPGSFYFLTAFPYSVYLALAALAFYLLHTSGLPWLWLPCAWLAITYPSGSLIGIPLAWHLWRRWGTLTRGERHWMLAALAAIPTAVFLYFSYYWWALGDFWLYVKIQSQSYYAHETSFPLWTVYKSLISLPMTHPVVLSLLFSWIATTVFIDRRLPGSWMLYLWGILLFTPAMGTTDCYYRHIVVAFPLAILMGLSWRDRWRRWLLVVFAAASVVINWWLLIPAYKFGQLM